MLPKNARPATLLEQLMDEETWSAWFYEAGFGSKTARFDRQRLRLGGRAALSAGPRGFSLTEPKGARCSRSVINEGFLADRDIPLPRIVETIESASA
jgi:hypothetical protein